MTPEGKVKKAFTDTARRYGLAYINLIETGDDGNPDKLVLPEGGVPAFIEFKRETGGELSPEQLTKISIYRGLGYHVFVVDSKRAARALAKGLASASGWHAVSDELLVEYFAARFG